MTIKLHKDKAQPCCVTLEWFHNHPLNALQVNSFKDILPETAEKVKDYFDRGFSPGRFLADNTAFISLLIQNTYRK